MADNAPAGLNLYSVRDVFGPTTRRAPAMSHSVIGELAPFRGEEVATLRIAQARRPGLTAKIARGTVAAFRKHWAEKADFQ